MGTLYLASAIPALVGPMIGGQLYTSFGENAIGVWTGSLLFGAGLCIGMAALSQRRIEAARREALTKIKAAAATSTAVPMPRLSIQSQSQASDRSASMVGIPEAPVLFREVVWGERNGVERVEWRDDGPLSRVRANEHLAVPVV